MALENKSVSVSVEYLHVCDYAFTGENGKPGFIGVFEQINTLAFPTHHPLMSIAVKLRGQNGKTTPVRISLTSPTGEVIVQTPEQPIAFGQDGGAFINFMMAGAQFKVPGRYAVSVYAQGEVVASQTLTVAKVASRVA